MSKAIVTVEGFISNELSLREAAGKNVLDVTVPVTPQKKTDNGWEDSGDTVWYKATFWEDLATAVLMSVEKGALVSLTGTPRVDIYTKADGSTSVSVVVSNPQIARIVRKGKAAPVQESWSAEPALTTSGWTEETPF